MRDSMHILDVLRERGYEPNEDVNAGEGWFDKAFGRWTLRVVLTEDGAQAEIWAFTGPFIAEWGQQFRGDVPPGVILTALDTAEASTRSEDYYGADRHLQDVHGPILTRGDLEAAEAAHSHNCTREG